MDYFSIGREGEDFSRGREVVDFSRNNILWLIYTCITLNGLKAFYFIKRFKIIHYHVFFMVMIYFFVDFIPINSSRAKVKGGFY